MSLIGATVIEQTESWNKDDETYEVAVLVCWSAKLEQAARATLTGEPIIDDTHQGDELLSVRDWLLQQDLGQMVGPRQFLDANGQRWLLGVTARPVSKNSAINENNKELVSVFASQIAAFSLFADVDTQTTAKQVMKVLSTEDLDKSETRATESLEQQLTQKFDNLQIQGLQKILAKVVTHPLTGQKIYVAAYGISPESAQSAMKLERQATLAAIQVHKGQAFLKGRSEALRDATNSAKNDAASKNAGKAQGKSEVSTSKTGTSKAATGGSDTTTTKKTAAPPAKTKAGSTKTSDVKDDF